MTCSDFLVVFPSIFSNEFSVIHMTSGPPILLTGQHTARMSVVSGQ